MKAKDPLSRLRISCGIHVRMRVTLITEEDDVLWRVCYSSQSQDVNFHAKTETSYYRIQNVE